MKKVFFILLLLAINAAVAFADTGVFLGAGNQVVPIKNDDIQLAREHVNIKLSIEKDNGKFGVPFIPLANVMAKFYLKNTTKKKVVLQMGFPFLDLQGFGDETFVLGKLDFKVLSNGRIIKAQLKEGLIEKKFDPQGLFKKVFAWKDDFQPQEVKTVVVSYKMLMSVASANQNDRNIEKIGLKFSELDKFFPAINYNFGYITKTAYTWKGPVEEAIFEVDANEFLKQFDKPNFVAGFGFDELPLSRPIYLENILPAGYQKQANTYQWKFKGMVPEDGLSINFLALFIPSLQSELRPFLKANVLKLKDVTPEEYRSVLRQYYLLLASDSKPVGSFLSGYFKEVKLTSGKSNFIFAEDKKNVQKIAEQFDILTKDQ